jgi:cytochrome bd-type quinol oxidase subunit 2
MTILPSIIKTAFAADPTVTIGSVVGIGPFGFEDKNISKAAVGTQFGSILSTVVTVLTVVGGLAFVIFFTLGGLKWLTSGGDKAKVQEAQTQMTQGVIGLVAIVAGLFVVGIVGGVLGIDILNPFNTLFKNVSSTPTSTSVTATPTAFHSADYYDERGNI